MAKYRSFAGPSRSILIEVDEGGGGAEGSLSELFGVLGDLATACADAMARAGDKKRPGELAVGFGLRALDDGSLAVALDPVKANFTVTMTWSAAAPATPLPRPT
ncbi:MAG: hypothetical protein M3O70_05245 [Actinomycetota bacterium]|nr:hypothetical protein [Actinomycetota bacterium]